MGSAALILGILAVIVSLIPWFAITQMVGVALDATAIILASRARKQALAQQGRPTMTATLGLASGIVAVLLGAFVFASCQACKYVASRDKDAQQQVRDTHKQFRERVNRLLEQVDRRD